ncbi:MAG: ATP-binding protein [Planctomycetota bacterium]
MANGTGLGLNLVKHVIENVHDGTIRVTSKRGEGSTFICDLPFADNT